jgi:hypothetical protein
MIGLQVLHIILDRWGLFVISRDSDGKCGL